MVRGLPDDGKRYEVVGGELLVTPAPYDRILKRRLFQARGVPEYWIVDLDAHLIERWRPGDERPEVLTDAIAWQPDAGKPPLEISLSAYFAEI